MSVSSRSRAGVVAIVASMVAAACVPATAAQAVVVAPPQAVPLAGALASPPAPGAVLTVPSGDFSNPPGRVLAHPTPSFDPMASVVDERVASPTVKTFDNPDGTRTVHISPAPTRFQDASGAWHDIDLTLVLGADGTLSARAAATSAHIGTQAAGTVVSVPTSAGSIGLSHPDAASGVAAVVSGPAATYPGGLGAGRDLVEQLTSTGFEESVVLAGPGGAASYTDTFSLPAGATAAASPLGIGFRSGSTSLGSFGGGLAVDGSGATSPVSVGLTGRSGSTISVTVSVSSTWLADPARVFPVTIDPLYTAYTSTYMTIASGLNPTTTGLLVGTNDSGAHVARSLVQFSVPAAASLYAVPNFPYVTQASVVLTYPQTPTCTATKVDVTGLAAPFNSSTTTWVNQPALDNYGQAGSSSFATSGSGGSCPVTTESIDVTALANRWVQGTEANNGLEFRADNEADNNSYKNLAQYYNYGGSYLPQLSITYASGPPQAAAGTSAPTDSLAVPTATPTLSVTAATSGVTDPAAAYRFRVATSPDGESGTVIDSGWITSSSGSASWTVPAGSLFDGVTYFWHAWTQDGAGQYQSPAGWANSFTVDLRLGQRAWFPADSAGPAGVNLLNGNATFSVSSPSFTTVSGPVGLSYTYNSQAQAGGLTGTYWAAASEFGSPVVSRTETPINFNWATSSPYQPAIPVGAPFSARWQGFVTVPTTGSYTFGGATGGGTSAANGDGVKIFVNNNMVLNDWAGQAPGAPVYSSSVNLTASTPVLVEVDYTTSSPGAALVLWEKLSGVSAPVPANWLSGTAPPLPAGWTLGGAAGMYVRAVIGSRDVTLIDRSGIPHTYTWDGSGYLPPSRLVPGRTGQPATTPNYEDGVLSADANGSLSLAGGDGLIYTFDPTGNLTAVRSAADDRHPAALAYTYVGPQLRSITDPVSGQSLVLHYSGDAACVSPPTGQGFDSAAPPGMLCGSSYWDATSTNYWYVNKQLARIDGPGTSDTDFAYTNGLVTQIRSPLAADAITAGVRTADGTERTAIAYDSSTPPRVSSVTLPAPTAGAARPAHSYTYTTATATSVSTQVNVAGLSPTLARTISWTLDNGTSSATTKGFVYLADTDATNHTTNATFDSADHHLVTVDSEGRQSTTIYNTMGLPTDVWGPAPSSMFSTTYPYAPSGSYAVPHSSTTYDKAVPLNGSTAGPAASQNLLNLYDASFEAGSVYDWGISNPPSLSLTATTTVAADGSYSMQMTSGAPGPMAAIDNGYLYVTPGSAYTATAMFRAASTAEPSDVIIRWLNSSQVQIGNDIRSGVVDDTTGGWTQAAITAVAPAGAYYAHVLVEVQNSATGEVHYVDMVDLRAGYGPGWAPGGQTAPAVSVAGNLLTTNQASLETNTTGWAAAANATIARVTTAAADGTASLAVTATATGPSVTTTGGTGGVPVQGGQRYTYLASSLAATTGRTANITLNWYDYGGTLVGSSAAGTGIDVTTGWTQIAGTDVAPIKAAYAAVVVTWPAATSGEVHDLDKIALNRGSSTTWSPGGAGGFTPGLAATYWGDNTMSYAGTNALPSDQDAYTQDGSNASTNYGTANVLENMAGQPAGTNRTMFLRFNVGSISNPTQAVLRLYGGNTGAASDTSTQTSSVYQVSNTPGWTETGITWNNKPTLGAKIGTSTAIGTTQQWYTWDITSWVQSQRAAGQTEVSVAITQDGAPSNGAPDVFSSREGANPPQLLVTSGGTTAPTVAGSAMSTAFPSASPFVLNMPTGIQSGDLLVASLSSKVSSFTVPTGWTQASLNNGPGGFIQMTMTRVAGSSEPSTVNVAFTGSGTQTVGVTFDVRGVASTSPIDALSTWNEGGNATVTGSVTTTAANDLILGFQASSPPDSNTVTDTQPAGWTKYQDAMAQYNWRQGSGSAITQASPGSTGTLVWTLSEVSDQDLTMVAIAPPPSTPSPTTVIHDTGVGTSDGSLVANWGTTLTPQPGLTPGLWSARYTGDLDVTSLNLTSYPLSLTVTGWARLWIDDTLVINAWADNNNITTSGWNAAPPGWNPPTSGRHRIRIEFRPGSAGAAISLASSGYGTLSTTSTGLLGPQYGLATFTSTDEAASGSAPNFTSPYAAHQTGLAYANPALGAATQTIVDPYGTALTSSSDLETDAAGHFWRLSRSALAAGGITTYAYYGADGVPATATNPCVANSPSVNQLGLAELKTEPSPNGVLTGRTTQDVYDARGRVLASSVASGAWTCTAYDTRGRVTSQGFPALDGEAARTVTYNYAVSANPLVTSVTDPAGTITATTDLLGRTISYTDVWGNTTTTTYDQAGRATDTSGPAGAAHTDYDTSGRIVDQKLDGTIVATPSYDTGGQISTVAYGNNTSLNPITRDFSGNTTGLQFNQNGGSLLTNDAVTRGLSGRIINETIDGTSLNATGPAFTYDSANRLVDAYTLTGSLPPSPTLGWNPATGTGGQPATTAPTVSGSAMSTTFPSSSPFVLNMPSGIQSGDLLVASISSKVSSFTVPSGWTQASLNNGPGGFIQLTMTRVAGSSEPSTVNVAFTGSGTQTVGVTFDVRGANTTSPIDALSTWNEGGNATITGSVTTTVANDLILGFQASSPYNGNTVTDTAPTGWTKYQDAMAQNNWRQGSGSAVTQASPGSTGTLTWTLSATADQDLTMVAIQPNPAQGPSVVHHLTYSYTAGGGCGTNTGSGADTNRTSATDNGAPTTYCYDMADRLTATADAKNNNPAYDANGNTTSLGGQTMTYDGANRHLSTTVTGTTVRYLRDATGRIVSRSENGTTTRYGFVGGGDSAALVQSSSGTLLQRTISLLGGVIVTKQTSGDTWSYPNIHGDVVATASASGSKQGSTLTYDPFGQILGGQQPENSSGNYDFGWEGQNQRGTEHTASLDTIEMGARPYAPSLGRFLTVDPIAGGSCNLYEYSCADPINGSDVSGQLSAVETYLSALAASARYLHALAKAEEAPSWTAQVGVNNDSGDISVFLDLDVPGKVIVGAAYVATATINGVTTTKYSTFQGNQNCLAKALFGRCDTSSFSIDWEANTNVNDSPIGYSGSFQFTAIVFTLTSIPNIWEGTFFGGASVFGPGIYAT